MESNPYTSPSANLFGASSNDIGIVPQEVILPLVRTKFWVRLISVILWISVAFTLLAGVGMGIGAFVVMQGGLEFENDTMPAGMLMAMSVMYVVMSFFYIFPAIKLWAYGSQITQLSISRSPADLTKTLNTQRSFWKFVGVLTLIGIILAILGTIGMVISGAATAMGSLPVDR